MAKGDRGGSPNLRVRCCCGQPDPPVGGPALLKVLLKGPLGVSFLVGEALCPSKLLPQGLCSGLLNHAPHLGLPTHPQPALPPPVRLDNCPLGTDHSLGRAKTLGLDLLISKMEMIIIPTSGYWRRTGTYLILSSHPQGRSTVLSAHL